MRTQGLAVRLILLLLAVFLGVMALSPPVLADDSPSVGEHSLSDEELADVQEKLKDPLWRIIFGLWKDVGWNPSKAPSQNPTTMISRIPVNKGVGAMAEHEGMISGRLLDELQNAHQQEVLRSDSLLPMRVDTFDFATYPELFAILGIPPDQILVFITVMNVSLADLEKNPGKPYAYQRHGEGAVKQVLAEAARNALYREGKRGGALTQANAIAQKIWDSMRQIYTPRSPCRICAEALEAVSADDIEYLAEYGKTKDQHAAAAEKIIRYKAYIDQDFKAQKDAADVESAQTAQHHMTAMVLEDAAETKNLAAAAENCKAEPVPQPGSLGPPSGGGVLAMSVLQAKVEAAGCEEDSQGALASEVEAPSKSGLGGIDLTSLQMRYLSDSPGSGGLTYAFSGQKLTGRSLPEGGQAGAAVSTSADNLRTWIALTPDKFWVNLSPDEPDRIIDPALGRTDAGKVMLEADFAMKRTEARLLDPATRIGRTYWQELAKIGSVCSISRSWIVPGKVEVRADGDELYVLTAELDVKTAPDTLPDTDPDACPLESQAVIDAKDALERRLILPKVVEAVNTAPEYAPMRRLFVTRILAQWIRDRHTEGKQTSFDGVLESGDLGLAELTTDWRPRQVFDEYVKSFRDHEFTYTHTTTKGRHRVTRSYVTGGVDLTNLELTSISTDQMKRQHPGLPDAVAASLSEATKTGDGLTWLGGSVVLPERNTWEKVSGVARDITSNRAGMLALVIGTLALLLLGFRGGSRRHTST